MIESISVTEQFIAVVVVLMIITAWVLHVDIKKFNGKPKVRMYFTGSLLLTFVLTLGYLGCYLASNQ